MLRGRISPFQRLVRPPYELAVSEGPSWLLGPRFVFVIELHLPATFKAIATSLSSDRVRLVFTGDTSKLSYLLS